jgi:hypothetical protein
MRSDPCHHASVFTERFRPPRKRFCWRFSQVLKNYQTDRPVNAAVIHPTKDHILLGGGQDAMTVTTTGSRVGKFETRFYYMVRPLY